MPTKLAKKFAGKTNLGSPEQVYKGLRNSTWGRKEWLRLSAALLVCGAIGYLTFSTFAVGTIAHPDGSLIQFGSAPSIYMIQGGHLRGITSEDAFNSNHFNWGMVVAGNSADAALPAGPNIGLRAGTLVMTPGNPTVWDIYDGGSGNYTKWGIPTSAIFSSLGYNYNQVMTVPASELPPDSLNLITGGNHAGGQFFNSGGIVYMVTDSGKLQVSDPTVLSTYNFPIYSAVPGDNALPLQGFLPFHEGSLVTSSDGTVWMIGCSNSAGPQGTCAMQKHGFTDPATFTGLGYNFGEVISGGDGNINAIPSGALVTAPAPPPPPPAPLPTLPCTPNCGVSPPAPTPKPSPPPACLPNNPLCTPANPAPPPPTPPVTKPTPKPTPPPACLPNNPLCNPFYTYKKPSGNIDIPVAGSRVYGTVVIGGWALDNTTNAETAISGISVSIDGHLAVGTLARGLTRNDVCAQYPSRPGCPNVGWQFNWNSATVANGSHEIEVTITDSDPSIHHSIILTRHVTTYNSMPPSGQITSPQTSSHVTGLIVIRGWAMDNTVKPESAITSVKISINGQLVGNAAYGQQNPTTDTICKNYPSRPGCPNIGWSFALDTTQYQDGSTLNVKATITDADSPPSMATIGATYVVGTGQAQTCPTGQTGTPPNCKTPPTNSGSGATQTIQVIYAYPKDVSPSSVELKNIPVGISQFQAFLKSSTAGVIPSKPKGVSVNLSSNIMSIQLPKTTLQYEQAAGMNASHTVDIGNQLFYGITGDLTQKLLPPDSQKYLAYIDGPFQDAGCGFGGQGGQWATWFINATQIADKAENIPSVPCEDRGSNNYVGGPMPDSYFQDLGPLHEIFHTMGLVAKCAPGYDTDPSHPSGHLSAAHDLMHWAINPPPLYVDQTHNNYYGPSLSADCLGLTSPQATPYFNTL